MAIDGTGRVYLAWPDRGYAAVRSDPVTGDSRIVISTSTNGSTWTVPRAIQRERRRPPVDAGDDVPRRQAARSCITTCARTSRSCSDRTSTSCADFGQRPPHDGRVRGAGRRRAARRSSRRRACRSTPAASCPARPSSSSCSSTRRTCRCSGRGTVPFMGDYIDLAPSPPFVLNENGTWSYNLARERQHRLARGLDRQPRRAARRRTATGQLHAGDVAGRSGRSEPLRSDDAGAGLRARPGRDAQPEHLHGARHRRPVRVRPGQQQAVQRLSARLRRRRRERVGACRASTG